MKVFLFGPHSAELRTYSWLCVQGSFFAGFRGPYGPGLNLDQLYVRQVPYQLFYLSNSYSCSCFSAWGYELRGAGWLTLICCGACLWRAELLSCSAKTATVVVLTHTPQIILFLAMVCAHLQLMFLLFLFGGLCRVSRGLPPQTWLFAGSTIVLSLAFIQQGFFLFAAKWLTSVVSIGVMGRSSSLCVVCLSVYFCLGASPHGAQWLQPAQCSESLLTVLREPGMVLLIDPGPSACT